MSEAILEILGNIYKFETWILLK